MTKHKALIFILLITAAVAVFATDTNAEKNVYVIYTGKKYHCKDCRTIQKSKKLIELTIKAAKENGYEPCKVCKPGVE